MCSTECSTIPAPRKASSSVLDPAQPSRAGTEARRTRRCGRRGAAARPAWRPAGRTSSGRCGVGRGIGRSGARCDACRPPMAVECRLRHPFALALGVGKHQCVAYRADVGIQVVHQRLQHERRDRDAPGASGLRQRQWSTRRLRVQLPTHVQHGTIGVVEMDQSPRCIPSTSASRSEHHAASGIAIRRCSGIAAVIRRSPPASRRRPRGRCTRQAGASARTGDTESSPRLTATFKHARSVRSRFGATPLAFRLRVAFRRPRPHASDQVVDVGRRDVDEPPLP